jgi:GT2 family glycosyltransferase
VISVCTAVYRAHPAPNAAGLAQALAAALGEREGELVVALNGISAEHAGIAPNVRRVQLEVNRGVAPAWNAATRASRGEVLVFCNDDVELGSRSLELLADALEREPGAAVVGPEGARWDIARARHLGWAGPGTSGRGAPCEAVSGFLFACRRRTWEQVGGFDEFYAPASWEEVDFCTAARAAGGRCYAIDGVSFRHEWGVSRRQPPWARARWDGRSETWRSIHRRNRRHFQQKWGAHPIAMLPADAACDAA